MLAEVRLIWLPIFISIADHNMKTTIDLPDDLAKKAKAYVLRPET